MPTKNPIQSTKPAAKNCRQLLAQYHQHCQLAGKPKAQLLVFDLPTQEIISHITAPFHNPENHHKIMAAEITIYNPTRPIIRNGKKYIFGRVETIDSETNSHIMFFEEIAGVWKLVEDAPHLHLQDPFHIDNIQGWQILGGVNVYPDPRQPDNLTYETVFYRYRETIHELAASSGEIIKPYAVGPKRMKDIRLIQLNNGKIGVFTRPQGGAVGLGKIGYTEVGSLNGLSSQINKAKIIENQFTADEWGGANDLHLLPDGRIGVLGHIAHYTSNPLEPTKTPVKNYYAMSFIFDPDSHTSSPLRIIATADDLPEADRIKPKFPTLGKVIFSGGLKYNEDGTISLYAGINDTKAVRFRLGNPFINS